MILTDDHIFINKQKYDRKLIDKIIQQASDPSIENIVIDGFSGIGGVTEGFSRLSNYKVIACINHWDVAIETHASVSLSVSVSVSVSQTFDESRLKNKSQLLAGG